MAIKDFQITSSGDLALDKNSNVAVLRGKDALTQIVQNALSLWKGNWYKDITRGVDWQNILKAQYNQNEVISIVTAAIKRVSYVTDVIDVSLKVTDGDRTALIAYTVMSTDGIVNGSEAI